MKTRDLGERAFLESIRELVNEIDGAVLGFDEDASDIPISESTNVVINIDTFVGSTDWLPGMSEAQVGRKTAVMALSDIAAKGATPIATMLSLCVPPDYDTQSAYELIRGFSQYCLKSGVIFIGGDMGTTNDVILTGVAIGSAEPQRIVTRGGAQVGDIIAVTSSFGLTSVAFHILLKDLSVDPTLRQRALLAAYKPSISLSLVSALANAGAITSSMDSSDGLGITLNTMANHSMKQLTITRLPTAAGVESFAKSHDLDLTSLVMNGGEEFTLVLTIPEGQWNKALGIAQSQKMTLMKIGTVNEGSGVIFNSPSGEVKIQATGYDNFREWG